MIMRGPGKYPPLTGCGAALPSPPPMFWKFDWLFGLYSHSIVAGGFPDMS
jgi:hypothetical protein